MAQLNDLRENKHTQWPLAVIIHDLKMNNGRTGANTTDGDV